MQKLNLIHSLNVHNKYSKRECLTANEARAKSLHILEGINDL